MNAASRICCIEVAGRQTAKNDRLPHYPGKVDFEKCRFLIGNRDTVNKLKQYVPTEGMEFDERRKPYLLY